MKAIEACDAVGVVAAKFDPDQRAPEYLIGCTNLVPTREHSLRFARVRPEFSTVDLLACDEAEGLAGEWETVYPRPDRKLLKRLRLAAGEGLQEFGERIGMSLARLHQLQAGEGDPATDEEVEAILRGLIDAQLLRVPNYSHILLGVPAYVRAWLQSVPPLSNKILLQLAAQGMGVTNDAAYEGLPDVVRSLSEKHRGWLLADRLVNLWGASERVAERATAAGGSAEVAAEDPAPISAPAAAETELRRFRDEFSREVDDSLLRVREELREFAGKLVNAAVEDISSQVSEAIEEKLSKAVEGIDLGFKIDEARDELKDAIADAVDRAIPELEALVNRFAGLTQREGG